MNFDDFFRELKSGDKPRSSKVSEQRFRDFIQKLIGTEGKVKRPKPVEINLDPFGNIEKRFDIAVEVRGKTTLIEVKKNIDNVEKDLFKFILLSQQEQKKRVHKYRKVVLIWEEEDRSGSYAKILEFAISKKWIDRWFYFCRGKKFQNEIQELKKFLLR